MKEIVKDYLWTFDFQGIDNDKLYKTCTDIETALQSYFPPIPPEPKKILEPKQGVFQYNCFTSYYHQRYNMFQFPCPQLSTLYRNMAMAFPEVITTGKQYYIRCWVNLFQKGKNIDWHTHWPAHFKTYHGFYCVNTEGVNESYTDYRVPGHEEVRIVSKDGLCVIGKSEGDEHRCSEWANDNKMRVTIAFDVIPVDVLRSDEEFLHLKVNRELLYNFIPLTFIKPVINNITLKEI